MKKEALLLKFPRGLGGKMSHEKRNLVYCPECGAGKEFNDIEGRCLQCGADLSGVGVENERFKAESVDSMSPEEE